MATEFSTFIKELQQDDKQEQIPVNVIIGKVLTLMNTLSYDHKNEALPDVLGLDTDDRDMLHYIDAAFRMLMTDLLPGPTYHSK